MDDPVNQIKGVIRSLIEPYRHRVIAENVSNPFKSDSQFVTKKIDLSLPMQLSLTLYGSVQRFKIQDMRKEYIRNNSSDLTTCIVHFVPDVYSRLFSINNRVDFQGVMFDETKEHCTIARRNDGFNLTLQDLSSIKIRVLIRVDLTKGADGKYLISKERSNIPTDLKMIGMIMFPGLISWAKSSVQRLELGQR
ncbi:hypothetical protein PSTT_05267, partial [Puccinia striiformis]